MPAEDRTSPSRRAVLRRAAGAGVAGLAAGALAGPAMAAAAGRPAAARRAQPDEAAAQSPDASAAGQDLIVHVRDVRSGELDVFRGTSHVRLTDRDLAARLVRAVRPSGQQAR